MQEPILSRTLVELNNYAITPERILTTIVITLSVWIAARLIKRWLRGYVERHDIPVKSIASIWRTFRLTIFIAWVIFMLVGLSLDIVILTVGNIDLRISNLLQLLVVLLLAKMADDIISARITEEISQRKSSDGPSTAQSLHDQRTSVTKTIQFSLVAIVLIIILPILGLDYNLESITINDLAINISLTKIISAILVILIARILIWLAINLLLYGWYRRESIDLGKQYAYNQLLTYVVYTLALIISLQYLGFNLTLMWASAAAILVGVGIALQQTISDFFSGIVLLFERSVEAGDFVDLGTLRGTVKKIGLRASIIETLERKDVIIPNSKLVNDNVVNWTKEKPVTRFEVLVGVAYGSDTEKVKELLLQVAKEAHGIMLSPKPFVRFLDFSDSALQFGLYFFSVNVIRIEDIKSDIRFRIDAIFRENNVKIPFPQRDLWIKEGGIEH